MPSTPSTPSLPLTPLTPSPPSTPQLFATKGTHLLADFWGVQATLLADCSLIEKALRLAAAEAGATILFSKLHSFGSGHGVTGVLLLAESHISIHTWPNEGLAAIDIYLCGKPDVQRALISLTDSLLPTNKDINIIARGQRTMTHHQEKF